MIAIGNYFVFIISVMGVICAIPQFSASKEKQFYEYILNEHNKYRKMHGSNLLEFNDFLRNNKLSLPLSIYWANKLLNTWIDTSKVPNEIGANTFSVELKENSKLNAQLAKKIVAEWYKTGENYNYDIEPTSKPNQADPFTQIVWASATEFGVKVRVYNDILYVVTCTYFIEIKESKYMDNVIKPQ